MSGRHTQLVIMQLYTRMFPPANIQHVQCHVQLTQLSISISKIDLTGELRRMISVSIYGMHVRTCMLNWHTSVYAVVIELFWRDVVHGF